MDTLLFVWWMFYFGGALAGSLVGTLLAFGLQSIYKKIKKWTEE